jgi:tetratricopeptide (TPR) repeat protein
VVFSPDGARIIARSTDGTAKLWEALTGKELHGEAIPDKLRQEQTSPDGQLRAHVDGNRVELIPLKLDAEELAYRRARMEPNHGRYRDGYLAARAAKDDFAAGFYLNLVSPDERKALQAKADVEALAPLNTLLSRHLGEGGNRSQALPLLEEIVKVKKDKLGPEDPDTLESMDQLGNLYWPMGQYDKAIPLFEEILKIREAKFGRGDLQALRAMGQLGAVYRRANRLKEALPLLEEAHRSAKNEPQLNWVTGYLIDAYQRVGANDKAETVLVELWNLKKSKLGPEHEETLGEMQRLGVFYWRTRQFDKSIPLFREIMKFREKKFGADNPETLNAGANLGVNLRDAGQLNEAIPLLEKAHQAVKRHNPLGWVTNELFGALLRLDNATAVKHWKELLPSLRADLGENHETTLVAMSNLGYALARTRQFTEAEAMLKDTIEREIRTLGEGNMLLLQTRTNLGELYQLQGQHAKAEELLRKCLAEREKKEPNSFRLASTQSMLGRVLAQEKKFEEAEPLLLAGYKGLRANAAATPFWGKYYLPDTLEWLTQLYEATNKPDEAKKWQTERANYAAADQKAPEKK